MATLPRTDPLLAALAVIPDLPLPCLALFVERALERLDEAAGDPELEDSEGQWWHVDARGRALCDPAPLGYCEDDEDDDPSGGDVDDEGEHDGQTWPDVDWRPTPR